jgi:hypothetical protein
MFFFEDLIICLVFSYNFLNSISNLCVAHLAQHQPVAQPVGELLAHQSSLLLLLAARGGGAADPGEHVGGSRLKKKLKIQKKYLLFLINYFLILIKIEAFKIASNR